MSVCVYRATRRDQFEAGHVPGLWYHCPAGRTPTAPGCQGHATADFAALAGGVPDVVHADDCGCGGCVRHRLAGFAAEARRDIEGARR